MLNRLKHLTEDVYYLCRPNLTVEKWADENMVKIHGCRQTSKIRKWKKRVSDDRPLLQNEIGCVLTSSCANIVGKGPSLNFLLKQHITDGPVLCINDAIVKGEELDLNNKLIHTMVDKVEMFKYKSTKPSTLVIQTENAGYTSSNHKVLTIYYNDIVKISKALSILYAPGLMYYCGIRNFKMYCFDSVIGDYGYADYFNRDTVLSLKKHKPLLEKTYPDCNFEWYIPKKDGSICKV